jgi:uncharacterized membrane protein
MPLTTRPFAHLKELDAIRQEESTNVGLPERIGSITAGAALVLYGASRRSFGGSILAALGGVFIYRGASGYCELYNQLGVNTSVTHSGRGVPGNKGIKVEQSIHVNRQPGDLFQYWRRLDNLPRFLPHIESVEVKTERFSHWVIKGPADRRIEWDAEIINEHPGSMISWQSLPGSAVRSAGSVRFEPENDGTLVRINLQYLPVGGVLGATVARLLGDTPEDEIAEDLARFKELAEKEG